MAVQLCHTAQVKYTKAKAASTPSARKLLLEEAAHTWQSALNLLDSQLLAQRKIVNRNLTMVHMNLVFAAAEDASEQSLQYHAKQMASHMAQSAPDRQAWTDLAIKFVDGVAEHSPSPRWRYRLLCAFASTEAPPQLLVEKEMASARALLSVMDDEIAAMGGCALRSNPILLGRRSNCAGKKAADCKTARVAGCESNMAEVLFPDTVEMACAGLHYLATFYDALNFYRQAHAKHRECVTLAMSLDGADANDLDALIEGRSKVKGFLEGKPWFLESVAYLQEIHRKIAEEERAENELRKAAMAHALQEIQAADTECWELLSFLCQNYPISEALTKQLPAKGKHANISKNIVIRFLAGYHPDKQFTDKTKQGLGLEKWKLLAVEITKMLNHYYEVACKQTVH